MAWSPLIWAQDGVESSGAVDACGDPTNSNYICRQIFDWTGNGFLAQAVDWFVAKPATILFVFAVAWLANRLVRRAVRRFVAHAKDSEFQGRMAELRRRTGVTFLDTGAVVSARRAQRAEAVGAVLRSTSTALIYGIAVLIALGEMGVNLGPLVAGAGIVGVALGFGAQSLVKDFLSGLFMIMEDQFGVGDIIDVGEASGVVEGISLRTTKVRDIDGVLWHVPNGEIRRVGNKSQGWARALLDIEVAYGTDVDKASAVIKRVADEMWNEPEYYRVIIMEEPEVWGVQTLGASGIAIRLVVKTVPNEQWDVARQLRGRMKAAFDAEGIEIPFPQRTVWLREEVTDGRDTVDTGHEIADAGDSGPES